MQIKIMSDGTLAGTKIIDLKTGEAIENVVMASWSVTLDGTADVMLAVTGVPCEIITQADEIKIPPMTDESEFNWVK